MVRGVSAFFLKRPLHMRMRKTVECMSLKVLASNQRESNASNLQQNDEHCESRENPITLFPDAQPQNCSSYGSSH